jgi:hypothetical protein
MSRSTFLVLSLLIYYYSLRNPGNDYSAFKLEGNFTISPIIVRSL